MLIDENARKHKQAFYSQRNNAKKRGIGWELTFEQWLEWWGEDIEKRGSHHNGLQMQRFGDTGPYALGNIKKGYPRDNSATWARTVRNRKADKAKRDHQAFLDALMWTESKPEKDEWISDEEYCPIYRNGLATPAAYPIDKHR